MVPVDDNMKVRSDKVLQERLTRRWSQEELAIAAGLSQRTIQRIEREAVASMQSAKALAAVFGSSMDDLEREEVPRMTTFEYKSVELRYRAVLKTSRPKPDEIVTILIAEGTEGWQVSHIQYPHARHWTALSL